MHQIRVRNEETEGESEISICFCLSLVFLGINLSVLKEFRDDIAAAKSAAVDDRTPVGAVRISGVSGIWGFGSCERTVLE
jgi:hypothetical protein